MSPDLPDPVPYTYFDHDPDAPPPVGMVLDFERGALPYALLHGEALVACAAWAMGEAGVLPADGNVEWSAIAEAVEESGAPVVLHDSLCPMTPPAFIAECAARAYASKVVVVGVRPVTDTVKTVVDRMVVDTVDREGLRTVCSPVVLPAAVAASLPALPSVHLDVLVAMLREHFPVALVPAPAQARRVASADDVRILEELTRS